METKKCSSCGNEIEHNRRSTFCDLTCERKGMNKLIENTRNMWGNYGVVVKI